jgi:hypothetical protein
MPSGNPDATHDVDKWISRLMQTSLKKNDDVTEDDFLKVFFPSPSRSTTSVHKY